MKRTVVYSSSSSGVGVVGLLGVLFVALKLLGLIDWSWWWVTLPFWGGFAALFIVLILIFAWLLFKDIGVMLKKRK